MSIANVHWLFAEEASAGGASPQEASLFDNDLIYPEIWSKISFYG